METLTFSTKYKADNAVFLAKLSREIYRHIEESIDIQEIIRSKFGFDNVLFFSTCNEVGCATVDLQFCLLKKADDLIIVFKGTEEKDDWLTNININKEKLQGTKIDAHSGFMSSLNLFTQTLKASDKSIDGVKVSELYDSFIKKDSPYNLILTGHSLGGAVATLLCASLKSTYPTDKVVCYTFGAPPVGWNDFYEEFKEINLHRVVNRFDPIPKVNRWSTHISDRLIPVASTWKSLKHIGKLKELPSDEYETHSSKQYISNLQKENKTTLKRSQLIDIKSLIFKHKWTTFLSIIITLAMGFGIKGYMLHEYSLIDSLYLSLKLFTFSIAIDKDLNIQLETARFLSLIFVSGALFKGVFYFLDKTIVQPFRLLRKRDHIVIFGLNGHVEELVKNFNTEEPNTQVVIVLSEKIDTTQINLKAEFVSLPPHLTVKFMRRLSLEYAKHIICMDMNDNIDLTHANGVIEYLDDKEDVEEVKLHIHLHSYTLPDLFNHENYMSLLGKMPCNIKIFNHYDNAARVLFRTTAMENFLDNNTTHWLISGEWNQKIAFMRYVAQMAYYEDETLPHITLLCEDVEASRKKIQKLFPKIHKTATINVVDTLEQSANAKENPVTHIAVLFEDDVKGLEEALLLNNLFKEAPIFLQQRYDSIITNEQIIPFGWFSELNKTSITLDELLDERAKNIHNYYRSLWPIEPWEELSLFKKNSNRTQAEHIPVKLRGIGWKSENDFTGYKEFLQKNDALVQKWARIEHLRWNALHYTNGWDHADERDDAKKLHHCLTDFEKLSKKDQEKDEPAILKIPWFIIKTYVISDVHGCYYTLKELLEKLPKNSRIIFVGDLCDRGLYSKEVIELVMKNNYEVVLGNHDDYMVTHAQECLDTVDNRWHKEEYMGGKETMDSYKDDTETLIKHIKWIKSLPRYILIDKYFITHSFALPYFKNRDSQKSHIGLLKNRITDEEEWGHDWEKEWRDYDIVNIFGHTHYDEVEIGKNYYGIDTGCVYGGKLTAIELPTMKITDVKLNKKDIK